jgi:transporter family protein
LKRPPEFAGLSAFTPLPVLPELICAVCRNGKFFGRGSFMNQSKKDKIMSAWFWYAIGAAVLYGLHQIFTKLASEGISDGLGGFVVEGSAALTILAYLAWLKFGGQWSQTASAPGVWYSVLTGICVGVGTLFFFLLFQKGGPLSAVPMILAGGAAIMAVAGIFLFKEPASWPRLLGIMMAIGGLILMRK